MIGTLFGGITIRCSIINYAQSLINLVSNGILLF